MASDVEKIFGWLYRRQFGSRVYAFDNLLFDAALTLITKSFQDAHAFVSRNSNLYWRKLDERLKEDRASGRCPLFEVFDYNLKHIVWPPARHSASHPLKKTYRRLFFRPAFLKAIDNLTHREYEALPCVIVKIVGGRHIHLTPPGNEWGIDFFASIENPSKLHVFDGSRAPVRIVGQCKKYGGKLEIKEVKEFSRTLEALRNRKPELEKHVPIWFRSEIGPIVAWLICHSGAQAGALSLAKDEGIVVSDSVDLAECLCFLKKARAFSLGNEGRAFLKLRCNEMIA